MHLAFCSHEAAREAVACWYHRPDMPRGKLVRVGVWDRDAFGQRLAGVVIFGSGSTGDLGKRWGLTCFECCELVRVALDPQRPTKAAVPTSRVLAIALKLLHRHSPGIRAVVSFADPAAGHIGTVYQAGGWIYLGRTAPRKRYIARDGTEYHDRAVSVSGVKIHQGKPCPCPKISECTAVPVPAKFRYVWPFDDEIRARLQPLAIAYPKKSP